MFFSWCRAGGMTALCHRTFFLPSFPPPSGNPACAVLCVRGRGHCRVAIAGDAVHNVSTMPRFWFACAPIGRRFGIPLLSFPPPSGNPGRPYAGYCAAANRLAGVHPRTRPPGCRIKCGMTAQTRRLCCPRGCCRGCHRLPPARKCAQGLPLSALNRTFAD